MRAHQFILREYSRDVTAQKLGTPLLQKFRKEPMQWQTRIVGDQFTDDQTVLQYLLGLIEKADPTKNKQYVPWIIRMYANSPQLKFEDVVTKVSPPLLKFYQLVQRKQIPAPNNDIGRIKDLAQLEQLVSQFADVSAQTKDANRGQAKEVYRDADLRIIMPEDTTAACYYGQGTKWCTAATGSVNMFDTYNKKGPMFILIPTKPEYNGEKYQLHFETRQFMNEVDRPVSLLNLVVKYPQIRDVFRAQAQKNNVKALLLPPEEYQQLTTTFFKQFKSKLMEFMYEHADDISKRLYNSLKYDETKVFRYVDKDEFMEVADEAFRYDSGELVDEIVKDAGPELDIYADEDHMASVIDDAAANWCQDQDFYSMIIEGIETMIDDSEDQQMDASYNMSGTVGAWLSDAVANVVKQLL